MNTSRIIIMLLGGLVIFGLPIWNLARLYGKKHVLWMITPPVLFISIFMMSSYLDGSQYANWFMMTRHLAFYWAIITLMMFGFSVLFMLVHYAFRVPKKTTFWLIIIVTLVYALGARINGERVVVKDLYLPAENITRSYQFVHITDLHNGSTDRDHAQKVVDTINQLSAEFVVILETLSMNTT